MSKMLPCVILAGGLGTRLRPVLGEGLPKAMASVDGQPFLAWMLRWLEQQRVTDVVLSLGYGCGAITGWLAQQSLGLSVTIIEEDKPLGTGGAIMHALRTCGAPQMIVLNGDTITDIDLGRFADFFEMSGADLAIAATRVPDASRYGTLEFDAASKRLIAFEEKRPVQAAGFINAGVYAVDAARLLGFDLPERFSYEDDFLRRQIGNLDMRVFPEITEFIDIGIPSDYERAQQVVPLMCERSAHDT
ncbi:nucleotidyltransferase family protein [Paraburkholderia metrosideri]|uniref:D-glycero-alpha-D-manno-heptose 1-phosphate guanylyltransferase n=1 Tax=Paraburkholderia metrosideri TaxID=580937 RepID=A0ABN7HP15_9BURK|nr:nucleotidyltransferase family protein [Paraburkholderia metrosideri]CAD6524280.1 D-glycero-alpha-D-manno-heptose 1-phosphate guanylyltransferase [Paraburkholderia metrosideri]